MTALADTLRRAAAFLDALPEDLPEDYGWPPVSNDSNDYVELNWYSQTAAVDVRIYINGDLSYLYLPYANADDKEFARIPFDGVTVPPEVVAAIRRVIA